MSSGVWAEVSQRDLLVDTWFSEQLVHGHGQDHARGLLVLLAGRGGGKSSLLAHLEQRAAHTYVAHMDCDQLTDGVRGVVDMLAQIAFQLSAEVEAFPPLQLPSYATLRLALAMETSPTDRETALRDMSAALDDGQGQERSIDLYVSLAEKLGSAAGLPAMGLAALPLLSDGLKVWQRRRVRRTLERHVEAPASPEDFLVGLSHGFQHGDDRQRQRAQDVLTRAFLDDLRRAYTTEKDSGKRTLRALVLLDNADDARGQDFLEALHTARRGMGAGTDPLLVVAAARSRLRLMEPSDRPSGDFLRCWQRRPEGHGDHGEYDGEYFVPLPSRSGDPLLVAQLRPLNRSEVSEQCRSVAGRLPEVPGVRRVEEWLGRVVHDLTGGHPYATASVLRALLRFDDQVPVESRLRRIVCPGTPLSVVDDVYERLFGDLPASVGSRLRRVAASAVSDRALAADGLWGRGTYLRDQVAALIRDDLRFDVARIDARDVMIMPHLARRHLLQELADNDAEAEAGTWAGAHRTLRDTAQGRDAAYHQLALGDVPAATGFLHELLEQVREGHAETETWCRALSWVQRAPHPRLHHPGDAVQEYHHTAARAADHIAEERMPIARLLIAGQLTLHPAADPYDRLWSDPLWDPTAKLRGEIAEQLSHLRDRLPYQRGLPLRDRIESYEKEPW